MSVKGNLTRQLSPKLAGLAPGLTDGFVRQALKRAIEGAGPFPGAAEAAEKQLEQHDGDVKKAVHDIIENHVRAAGVEGFATNVGGLVTAAMTVPANIAGLALIQCRMVAAIAHLRGYDLDDPRVRNAVLITVLGEDIVDRLVKKKNLPAPPMALATAPQHDAHLDRIISAEVAAALISRVAGKRLATTFGRRIPLAGSMVGMTADGFATWRIGRYADRELLPRARR